MNELIQKVSERAGISEDQAQKAVETVVGFLKERLPAPIAGQVDNVLNSSAASGLADRAGDMLGGLGGIFGGNKG